VCVCVCAFSPGTPPVCYCCVFLLTYLSVCVSLYWQSFQQVPLVLVVPSPQININEMRKSSYVTGWRYLQVGQQNVRGLECKCENITSESSGDVTCDSLDDVTWSHGTHDVKISVGKVRRIWMII